MVAASVVPGVEVVVLGVAVVPEDTVVEASGAGVVLGVAVVPGGDVVLGVVDTVVEKHNQIFREIPTSKHILYLQSASHSHYLNILSASKQAWHFFSNHTKHCHLLFSNYTSYTGALHSLLN